MPQIDIWKNVHGVRKNVYVRNVGKSCLSWASFLALMLDIVDRLSGCSQWELDGPRELCQLFPPNQGTIRLPTFWNRLCVEHARPQKPQKNTKNRKSCPRLATYEGLPCHSAGSAVITRCSCIVWFVWHPQGALPLLVDCGPTPAESSVFQRELSAGSKACTMLLGTSREE